MKKVLIIISVILAITFFLVYNKYFGHYPRNRHYEQKLISFLKDVADKNDSSYFRLDSIMNFKWHKVIFIGPYFSSIENINCNIDSSILKNTAINVDDRFSGLLFLNEKNKPVKFLQFEGNTPHGFDILNTQACGTLANNAILRVINDANGVQKIQVK